MSLTSLLLAGAISSTGLLFSMDMDARLLEAKAVEAYQRGDYPGSEALHRKAIEGAQGAGADRELAAVWSNLGLAIYQQGRYTESEQAFARALALQERLDGESDPGLAKTLNNLALAQRARGLTLQARSTLQRALDIENRTPGFNAGVLAATTASLGAVYYDLEQYSTAEKLFRQSLARMEDAGDETGRAAALGYLARFESWRGNLDGAAAMLAEELAIRERTFGPDHPKTAETRNELAQVYSRSGNDAEAEAAFRRAIESLERSGGADNPQLANPLMRYADHQRRRGHYDAAEPLYRRSLQLLEGRQDDSLPELYTAYADVLKKTHHKRESDRYMAMARTLLEERPGRHTVDVSAFRE